MNDISSGVPTCAPRREATPWETVMAFGHGAKIMANDRVGKDRYDRDYLLALHPETLDCARFGCYEIQITGSILDLVI